MDQPGTNLSAEDINAAVIYWLRISQLALPNNKHFTLWSQQFELFKDGDGFWSGGRLGNVEVSPDAINLVFLDKDHPLVTIDKDHPLVTLIMRDYHSRVIHGGVKVTLTQLHYIGYM